MQGRQAVGQFCQGYHPCPRDSLLPLLNALLAEANKLFGLVDMHTHADTHPVHTFFLGDTHLVHKNFFWDTLDTQIFLFGIRTSRKTGAHLVPL